MRMHESEITHTHTLCGFYAHPSLQVSGLFPDTSHWNVAVNRSGWGLSGGHLFCNS